MRIALLNCYLQGGHTENAEIESTARLIRAACGMGIEVRTFARSEDIYDFEPDFVLALSYQDPKLTSFPTYGLLTMPVGWIRDVPRFLRNVLSYDGYWTLAPSVSKFVGALYARAGKPDLHAVAAISYPRTDFVPLEFSRAWAAYLGTNWDGQRHGEIFRALAPLGVAKFYGKRERWSHLPSDAFGGEVPFDGVSALNAYRSAGMGLCLNHPEFDAEGIPTSRIFEVPAAGAVVVAAHNDLVKEAFGDAALYIDSALPPDQIAKAIRDHVEWVRAHPKHALEMARTCHHVFNQRFALEVFLSNALEMHNSAAARLGFAPPQPNVDGGITALGATIVIAVRDGTLRHLKRCLDSVAKQTLAPRAIVVLDATTDGKAAHEARAWPGLSIVHSRLSAASAGLATLLSSAYDYIESEWVSCISAEEVLFPNHLACTMTTVKRHRADHGGTVPRLVYSGMAQFSELEELPELLDDPYRVRRAEHMRVAQFDFGNHWGPMTHLPVHPASCLLHMPSLRILLRRRWVMRLLPGSLIARLRFLAQSGSMAFTGSITLATSSTSQHAAFGKFTSP
jgi:hypothetical protein